MEEKKMVLWVVAVLAVVLGGGCATLSQQECLEGDWYAIGFKDGAAGKEADLIQYHEKACAEHGLLSDKKTYVRGRSDGLVTYCTEQVGYEVGSDIKKYEGVCPPDSEQAFLQAYLQGLSAAEEELSRKGFETDNELRLIQERVQKMEREVTERGRGPNPGAPPPPDQGMKKEYEKLQKRAKHLKKRLKNIENKIKKIRNMHHRPKG